MLYFHMTYCHMSTFKSRTRLKGKERQMRSDECHIDCCWTFIQKRRTIGMKWKPYIYIFQSPINIDKLEAEAAVAVHGKNPK